MMNALYTLLGIVLLVNPTSITAFSHYKQHLGRVNPSLVDPSGIVNRCHPTSWHRRCNWRILPSCPCRGNTCFLFQEKPGVSSSGGSARFSGIQSQDATSFLDVLLRAIVSDIGSIVMGLAGLAIVVFHRLTTMEDLVNLQSVDALSQETRTDLLAVFACGAVLLNGVSKLDVTSALAESVVLDGILLDDVVLYNESYPKDLTWTLTSLLVATPAKSALLLEHSQDSWKTVAIAGIAPRSEQLRLGPSQSENPILDSFLGRDSSTKEKYLPTLQALPGRVEFTYFPPNTQEILLLPVSRTQVLVLGSNTAKSFSPRDIAWSQVISSRLGAMCGR